jgi:hypothetical protein
MISPQRRKGRKEKVSFSLSVERTEGEKKLLTGMLANQFSNLTDLFPIYAKVE